MITSNEEKSVYKDVHDGTILVMLTSLIVSYDVKAKINVDASDCDEVSGSHDRDPPCKDTRTLFL